MSLHHCTPAELIDVIDGVVDEASLPHLAGCASCRGQLAEVREALGAVERVEVPEPSPLFWSHLSARVRKAVAQEPQPGMSPARDAYPLRWKVGVPLAAAAVMLLAVLIWRGPEESAPTSGKPLATAVVAVRGGQAEPSRGPDDPSIGLMMELASTVDLESAADAGLMTPAGVTDAAVLDLSSDEQRELERLLREAMGGA